MNLDALPPLSSSSRDINRLLSSIQGPDPQPAFTEVDHTVPHATTKLQCEPGLWKIRCQLLVERVERLVEGRPEEWAEISAQGWIGSNLISS